MSTEPLYPGTERHPMFPETQTALLLAGFTRDEMWFASFIKYDHPDGFMAAVSELGVNFYSLTIEGERRQIAISPMGAADTSRVAHFVLEEWYDAE